MAAVGATWGTASPVCMSCATAGEAAAELTAGMKLGEVAGFEAECFADVDGERVAEGEHGGGGGGGSELVWAGFAGDADVERDVGWLGERGGEAAAEADERGAEARDDGEEAKELFGFAAVGEGEEDVAAGEDAEVAVEGFGGVEELGGGAGGDEGGGDFAGDEAAFADSGEDDAVVGLGGGDDAGVQARSKASAWGRRRDRARGEGFEGGGFDADELGGGMRIELGLWRCRASGLQGRLNASRGGSDRRLTPAGSE